MKCDLHVKMAVQISPTANTRNVVPMDRSTTRSFRLNPLSAYALQVRGARRLLKGKVTLGDAPDADNDLSNECRDCE